MHFDQPQLKQGCTIRRAADGISLSYLGTDFTVELDEPEKAGAFEDLLGRLDGRHSLEQLRGGSPGLSDQAFDEALALLDENFLLTEGAAPLPDKSGIAFVTELEDLYYNIWMQDDGETELVRQLFDGEAARPVVLGWCLESFHVTRRAHDCLAPIIARFHGDFKAKAVDYFLDEYRHDKLIMKSLTAAGFAREEIEACLPLPYTHAVMNLLAKWANSDLLSFMACLFVFEGTPEIGDGYIESLAHYDLEADFVKGQSVHNDINNEGGHGNVTRDFFKLVGQVGLADQLRVVRNLRLLYEAQRRKHDTLLRYYQDPTIGIPRLLIRDRPDPLPSRKARVA